MVRALGWGELVEFDGGLTWVEERGVGAETFRRVEFVPDNDAFHTVEGDHGNAHGAEAVARFSDVLEDQDVGTVVYVLAEGAEAKVVRSGAA